MASTFETITKGLASILDWLDPTSENFIFKKIWFFLTDIVNFLNPAHEDFFGRKLVELIGELLKKLFVPSENSVNNLVNEVSSHFSFMEIIKSLVNDVKNVVVDAEGMPSFTLHLNATKYTSEINVKILDLAWYSQFKQYGDAIITGFVYAFFVWKIFIKLPGIVSGVSGDIQDINDIDFSKFKNGGKKK